MLTLTCCLATATTASMLIFPCSAATCKSGEIPLVKADGSVDSCQQATAACPASFPVTVRENAQGVRAMCLTSGVNCPTGYQFAAHGFLSPGGFFDGTTLTVTDCYKNGAVSSCALLAVGDPTGLAGNYSISVVTNTTGAEQLLGCVVSTANACPARASFTWLSYNAQTQGTVVEKCSPASEVFRCTGSGYPTAGYTASTLTACIKGVTAAGPSTAIK